MGYIPEVILADRRINDGMGTYLATQLVKKLTSKKTHVDKAKILVLGFIFKGNSPDVCNTKIIDTVNELKDFNMSVDVYDSWENHEEVKHQYGIELITELENNKYAGIVLAVEHDVIKVMGIESIRALTKKKHVIYDLK